MATKNRDDEIYLILHNIRSAYNVGSIFRTADAAGIQKIFLCGYTPDPKKDPKISKTSLGAEKIVPWEKYKQTWRLLEGLAKSGIFTLALEQAPDSIDFRKFKPQYPLVLVLGNEVRGLSKEILSYCDKKIEIPMKGKKESLNVSVAFGIAIFNLIE
jgi:tRNA G18 (ribose-2'-O)-methylase SpoU